MVSSYLSSGVFRSGLLLGSRCPLGARSGDDRQPHLDLRSAIERKTGARGLRSILEGVLLDSMYTIPSRDDVSKVVIDESVIKGDSEPLLVYQNSEPARAASTEE